MNFIMNWLGWNSEPEILHPEAEKLIPTNQGFCCGSRVRGGGLGGRVGRDDSKDLVYWIYCRPDYLFPYEVSLNPVTSHGGPMSLYKPLPRWFGRPTIPLRFQMGSEIVDLIPTPTENGTAPVDSAVTIFGKSAISWWTHCSSCGGEKDSEGWCANYCLDEAHPTTMVAAAQIRGRTRKS